MTDTGMDTAIDDATGKVELGSPEWIALAEGYLRDHVGSLPADLDARFSLCEVFTRPPAHLDDGAGEVAWWLAIAGRSASVGTGRRDDVDIVAEVDYQEALPKAREVLPLDGPSPLPQELIALLRGLHNFLAPRTS